MDETYGIFEDGGAKGLAHIGALAAAEEHHIAFTGVAGSSAGAIVASLIAVGYRPSELFDPASTDGKQIFDHDFVSFFGRVRWFGVSIISALITYPVLRILALVGVVLLFGWLSLQPVLWMVGLENVSPGWIILGFAVVGLIILATNWQMPFLRETELSVPSINSRRIGRHLR